jgi:hypothetical protein
VLLGQTSIEDGESFVVTNCSHHDGVDCLDYKNNETGEEHYSTLQEVRRWIKQSKMLQLANNIQPARKGFRNTLAETMFRELQPKNYKVQLPSTNIKPPKNFNDVQGREEQWFEAFKKERDGMPRFSTCCC